MPRLIALAALPCVLEVVSLDQRVSPVLEFAFVLRDRVIRIEPALVDGDHPSQRLGELVGPDFDLVGVRGPGPLAAAAKQKRLGAGAKHIVVDFQWAVLVVSAAGRDYLRIDARAAAVSVPAP